MVYKVAVTNFAWNQLNNITDYIVYDLMNPDAAESVLDDFEKAVDKLEKTAASFALCSEPELAQHGYRRYHLESHRYILLYRIVGQDVFIDRVYHELQDYQNLET